VANPDILAQLSARFDVGDVKQRAQAGRKLDYISIDATIRRFNDVLANDWSTVITSQRLDATDNGYLAVIALELTALGKTAAGVGADKASDPDKALKTALAEALKKAGHQFGVGLYLWDEGERAIVQRDRAAAAGDIAALKAKVFEKALEGGAKATADGVAGFYGVKAEELQDATVLAKLLEQ
jgi:hypothetical protein